MQNERDPREQPARAAAKPASREDRLKAELRANLAKRKLQARARRQGSEDSRPGALMSVDDADAG